MTEEVLPKKLKENPDYTFAVGRRRESIARVRLYKTLKDNVVFGKMTVKKGDMLVNGKNISEYFVSIASKASYEAPFNVTDTLNKYTVTIQVEGGGNAGQLGAAVMGIARALSKINPENRDVLKKKGYLERDSRTRQRRNVGMGGKSRRKRQSPKR